MKTGQIKRMLRKVCAAVSVVLLLPFGAQAAVEFTWTGKGGDGKWSTPENWSVGSGYPGSAATDDRVVFAGDATVALDLAGTADGKSGVNTVSIGGLSVTAGSVSIVPVAGAGALFVSDPSTVAYIDLAQGSELMLDVDLYSDCYLIRQGLGKFTDTAKICICAASRYLAMTEGENVFTETSEIDISQTNGDFYMSSDMQTSMKMVFRGKVKGSRYAGGSLSSAAQDYDISQEGDANVSLSIAMFGGGTLKNDTACYTVKGGTFSASIVSVNGASNKTGREGVEHFVVDGGAATIKTFQLDSGSAALKSGTLTVSSALTNADPSKYRLYVTGGAFNYNVSGATFDPSENNFITWDGDFAFRHAPELVWNWRGATVGANARYTDGGGSIRFPASFVPEEDPLLKDGLAVADGAVTSISPGTVFRPKAGSTTPWKVSVGANAGVVVNATWNYANPVCSRLSLPLDLSLAAGAYVSVWGRGALVAHRVVCDGVEQPKGIYRNDGTCPWVKAPFTDTYGLRAGGISVIVPAVWTGGGADTKWSTAANWADNEVPASGVPVDLSRATTVTLDGDVTAGAIVAMPSGANKRVVVEGAGTVTLATQVKQTALYVADDAELVFKVDVKRSSDGFYGMVGGGRFVFAKSWPGSTGMTASSAGVDGTIVFAAEGDDVVHGNAPDAAPEALDFFSVLGFDNQYVANVEFAGSYSGTYFAPISSADTYVYPVSLRQTAGKVEFSGYMYLENHLTDYAGKRIGVYYLDGGELWNVNSYICMDGNFTSVAQYGMTGFEMSGGEVHTKGFFINDKSYLDLHGGTVYLTDSQNGWWAGATAENPYRLGGVTIAPQIAREFSGYAYLSGVNGNVKFDCSNGRMDFNNAGSFSGPGGIECTGGTLIVYNPAMTFDGPLFANGGTVLCRATNFNGIKELRANGSRLTIQDGCTITTQPDVIDISANWVLTIQDDIEFHPKKFIVGGEEMPAGTYAYTTGRIVVSGDAPASWTATGDLSYESGETATLATDTTFAALVYRAGGAAGTKTVVPQDAAKLTLSDGAIITVDDNATLVIDADVVLAGDVTKTGNGKVVFNGAISGSGSLTAKLGDMDVNAAVTGVAVATAGEDGAKPVLTLGGDCTVAGGARILTAQSAANAWGYVSGKTVQNGAAIAVDGDYVISNPQGGTAEYVMNGGSISAGALSGCDIAIAGTVTFGGALVANNLVNAGDGNVRLSGTCGFAGEVDPTLGLEMPAGAILSLNGDLAFDTLVWKGLERKAGTYRPGENRFGRDALAGVGSVAFAYGVGPGMMILVR